jgi:methionyl-tRNA formyltransferase
MSNTKDKLKIGFLISNKNYISLFYFKLIQKIISDERYLAEFIFLENNGVKNKSEQNSIILSFIIKLENKLFKVKNYPNSYVDVSSLLMQREVTTVGNISNMPYVKLNDFDLDTLRNKKFDVLFRIGWGIIQGEVLEIPQYGIWSLHHGDYQYFRGKPALFWELYKGLSHAGCVLQKLTSKLDDGKIIDSLNTSINLFSYSKSISILYYKSLEMFLDNLEKVQKNKNLDLKPKNLSIYTNELFKTPNIRIQIVFFLKLISRNIFRKLKINNFNWHIAIAKKKNSKEIKNYKIVPNRKGFFSADPFIINYLGDEYVFFEEASLKNSLGHISYLKCNDFSKRGIALKENFHLSFPNIFYHENEIYMLPETRKSNSIRLYKCINFPDKWELKSVLLNNISACDSEIFYFENRFYLFTNVSKNENLSNADNLCIFTSNNILGPYEPHKMNPISRDCRNSRMAGRIVKEGNDIYRIAQSGEFGYGSAIVINKIKKLNDSEYEEMKVQMIYHTTLKEKGLHTLNFGEKYAVLDLLIPNIQ